MAEIVGLVAGGAGLASLAVQILENTRILADFYSTVRDAPEQIGVILEEIDVLAHVLVEFSRIQGLRTTGLTDITTQIQVNTIHQCKIASDCLSNIVSELNTGMRLQPRRFSLLTALRTRKLDKLLLRLERAKSTLTLAQILYLQLLQRRSHETQKIGYGISASPPRPSGSPGSGTTSNRNAHYVLVDHGTEYYLGIGTVRSLKRQGPVGEPESESEGHELQFRIAPWFKAWGISLIIKRQFGYIQFTLRPLRLVTGDSPIMKACAMGDTEEVRRLVTTKEASPSDATYDDVTPLHIAASWLRPETCRLLLELGADAASIVRYQGITWTPLGLAVERAGYYRIFLFPDLEELRPDPDDGLPQMRETMRVLLEHGNSDLHDGYLPGKPGEWNKTRSALHGFRGSYADYLWLTQKKIGIDEAASDDYKASIVLQQTEMFPNDSFMAAMSQITNTVHLANFTDRRGSRLLHYLMDSNWGTEPGVWMNGVDVFTVIEHLLRDGADPCAHNSAGETPLMLAARRSLRFFTGRDETLSCREASSIYSWFLERWVSVLRSCSIDLKDYCRREQPSGPSDLTPCTWPFEDSHPLVSEWKWFVRTRFEVGPNKADLRIEFEYQKVRKVMSLPGAWDDNIAE